MKVLLNARSDGKARAAFVRHMKPPKIGSGTNRYKGEEGVLSIRRTAVHRSLHQGTREAFRKFVPAI